MSTDIDDPSAYQDWIVRYDSPGADMVSRLVPLDGPVFGLAMVVSDSDVARFEVSLASLKAQIHAQWDLVVATCMVSPWSRRRIAEIAQNERRITLHDMPKGATSGAALAEAFARCQGAFRGCVVRGDALPPSALYEIGMALSARPDALMVYTDEDQKHGRRRMQPRFKPGYSPEAMQGCNMVGQLALYSSGLLETIGGLSGAAQPDPCFDLAARAAREAGADRIIHVPAILYHRAGPPPDAQMPLPAAPADGPWSLVSIIICTRDHAALLATCMQGVLAQTDYPALEVLIVDNGSVEPDALALLDAFAGDPRVRVLRQPGAFNFAEMNNTAAHAATGQVLLLLNNDVEVIEPGWLRALVTSLMTPGVGAAGAKLLYPDRTVQHAGLLLGPAGAATHVGRHAPASAPGYLGQLAQARGLSAVTGACLAVRAEAWRQVGGMDTRLAVTWNDVDFCLRLGKAGLRVVWTPDSVLLHHESASRGLESEDPAKLARFQAEQALMREIWGRSLDEDPFLNPNLLAEESGRLSLAAPRHRRPWKAVPLAT